MEDKNGSHYVREAASSGWIASATFDLFLLANIGWPLLLIPGLSTNADTAVDFWQVYFLTLPHRWITLLLVLVDPDRRTQKSWVLASIATMLACVVVGSFWGSGAFLCLGFVDYVWNGWHFASQHSGVLSIYSKKVGGGSRLLERWGLRGFIFFVILRTSSAMLWPLSDALTVASILEFVDLGILAIPCCLIVTNLWNWHRDRLPKMIYLVSVTMLYSGYLMMNHFHQPRFVLCLATAASLFHAVEYLAIVSHYARRRKHVGSSGFMRAISRRWALCLTIFMLSIGTFGAWSAAQSHSHELVWQGLNLWAAFTHYAFDGLIWKLRSPETARALVA